MIQIKVPLTCKLSLRDTPDVRSQYKAAVYEQATKEPRVVVYDTILMP